MRVRSLAIAVAAQAALLAGPLPAGPATATVPDATVPGAHAVTVVEYDAGYAAFATTGREVWADRLRGALFVPDGAGPFPVVLLLHGVGNDCQGDPDISREFEADCRFEERVQNHRGYDYLGENLASHGYLAVSLLTRSNSAIVSGGGLTDGGAVGRAEILVRTLDLLAAWNAAPAPGAVGGALVGRVDLGRIGAMGHSRGGEGVAKVIEHAARRTDGPRYRIGAVITVGGTDAVDLAPHGAAFGAIVPMCDGDVTELDGAYQWDRGRFADPAEPGARVQFAVRGANHTYFNSVWAANDDAEGWSQGPEADAACGAGLPGSLRMTAAEQQRVGLALVASFFRRYLGGETQFEPLMTGAAGLPPGACPAGPLPCAERVGTSYLAPAADRDVLLAPTDEELASGAVTLAGFTTARLCDPHPGYTPTGYADVAVALAAGTAEGAGLPVPSPEDGRCPSNPTRSAARQLSLRWDGQATLAAPLGSAYDATRFAAVTFRTAVNFPEYGAASPAVDVVLRDALGQVASVPAAAHTHALAAPDGTTVRRLVLNGVRVPLSAFSGVDLARLTAVELRFGATGPGSVQLTELAFQR